MKQPCDEAVIRSGTRSAPPKTKSRSWILAATIVGSSMAFIDGTVVNVALPALQSSLHATVVDVQWVVESYGLFLSSLVLVGGALGDSIGRRRMFLLGIGLFGAASVCQPESKRYWVILRAGSWIAWILAFCGSRACSTT